MADGSWDVQAAIYSALIDAGVSGGDIYDAPPQSGDTPFPYVQIGESQTIADDVTCSDGLDEFVDLHVWSRYAGQKEAKDTISDIRDVLHNQILTVSGRTAHAWIQTARVMTDPQDALTRHGIVTVRVQHHSS